MSRRLPAYLAAAGLLGLFGAVRLPLETRLTRDRRETRFGTVNLNLSLREQLGQSGFLAALSGFRALVADIVWLQAHTAWENVAYGRMNRLLDTATTLVPQNTEFWESAAWHMAYNAAVHAREDPSQPRKPCAGARSANTSCSARTTPNAGSPTILTPATCSCVWA